ncbi:amidase [Ponticaulis sp.]|uniref:amidase n=1 Tax=Ponticaulis sp. TaxID=2020902 RepID=UPI000B6D5BF6|nr:amidase [Ponticaulis sp.]MAJ07598.1 amidase [Ponticaulis sp.]RPG17825.1 MAG: amidase [Hyphomonadaceae bacterium TMED125]HBH91123.1 amidase [Hyphomonadaceae bacterium]|tara:strand:+ start:14155 stop:15795 length:1641 start_codon:yes stop_codon:yes gene_type:complete
MIRKHLTALSAAAILAAACGTDTTPAADETTPETPPVMTDYTALTLPELAEALEAGNVTSEMLVTAYLQRIDAVDENGPAINAVLSLNPDAIEQARAIDARRAAGEEVGILAGVPVLLKDNIDTADNIPTTAGSLALAQNYAEADAPLVEGLRGAGAIILGKTNLSEWANFRSNGSLSGWSGVGGHTRNPHVLDRQTCGSSAGSGAAMAAMLAAGTVGTETNGSIICPSQGNGVVGFKPTVGLVSQAGIVPISSSQDTAGPMTRTVEGAAMMLTAMATGEGATDYVSALSDTSLEGVRIGVLRYSVSDQPGMADTFNAALEVLEAQGAELVEIDAFESQIENFGQKAFTVLVHEFKTTLNEYLEGTPEAVESRTLTDLIAFNEVNAETELSIFGQDLFTIADATNGIEDEAYVTASADVLRGTRELGIDLLMSDYGVDVLVSPSGPIMPVAIPTEPDVWPSWSGAGGLAAVAGYPHLTVPMGTIGDVPVGISFMGTAGQDAQILSFGYDYEQASMMRADPQFLESSDAPTPDRGGEEVAEEEAGEE